VAYQLYPYGELHLQTVYFDYEIEWALEYSDKHDKNNKLFELFSNENENGQMLAFVQEF
jgi:hypothetical protein